MKNPRDTLSGKSTLEQMKTREREDRKNLIIDAAEHVFASKAFDKVSMREIAEQAGIATSSIYTYFPTQESLFLDAVLRDSNRLLDEIQRMIDESGSVSNIESAIDAFIEFISRNDSYYRMMVVFMTQGNLTAESMNKLNSVVRRGYEMFDGVHPGRVQGRRAHALPLFLRDAQRHPRHLPQIPRP